MECEEPPLSADSWLCELHALRYEFGGDDACGAFECRHGIYDDDLLLCVIHAAQWRNPNAYSDAGAPPLRLNPAADVVQAMIDKVKDGTVQYEWARSYLLTQVGALSNGERP